MTWLGDTNKKLSDTKREELEKKRAALVEQIKAKGKTPPNARFEHQVRMHQQDLKNLALEIAKIDEKLGRKQDWNSGVRS